MSIFANIRIYGKLGFWMMWVPFSKLPSLKQLFCSHLGCSTQTQTHIEFYEFSIVWQFNSFFVHGLFVVSAGRRSEERPEVARRGSTRGHKGQTLAANDSSILKFW